MTAKDIIQHILASVKCDEIFSLLEDTEEGQEILQDLIDVLNNWRYEEF
jgi:hypothetical protein